MIILKNETKKSVNNFLTTGSLFECEHFKLYIVLFCFGLIIIRMFSSLISIFIFKTKSHLICIYEM